MKGELYTAKPLDASTLSRIEQRFTQTVGEPVTLEMIVQPKLLGGIRIMLDGQLYDDTIAGQLASLGAVLKGSEDPSASLKDAFSLSEAIRSRLKSYEHTVTVRGAGQVLSAGDGIARISGLAGCRSGELVELNEGVFGIAMNLEQDRVDVVILNDEAKVREGDAAYCTGQVLSVPAGDCVLGRVLNPLGQPIDGLGPLEGATSLRPIEAPAPSILDRQPVDKPMETGLISIDAMVPIGRGQRELIIGDRQTGKTSVAIDTILNQRGKDVACIYVAIGQKASTVSQIIETLQAAGALEYTCVVCSTASDSATMQYIAPYCGCALAEHFMYSGRDALVVYDDLSKHAVAYRAMSLLLRRPPGREAYPGDVFYLHSRLLERAAHLSKEKGGGSMTALPIIETQAGDISAYIPTNVISITDGQIFLDSELFRAGTRPAVNVGLSVSRVGGAAQTKAMRAVAGQMRIELAQFRELAVFSQFSSDMDKTTQSMLAYGAQLTEVLKQRNSNPLNTASQVALLFPLTRGLIPNDLDPAVLEQYKAEFAGFVRDQYPPVFTTIAASGKLEEGCEEMLTQAAGQWLTLHGAGEGK